MRLIADGKEEVLAYLEAQIEGLPGHPGRYMLAEDDQGRLVICVAGLMFIGEGEAELEGVRLILTKGVARVHRVV